MLILDDDREEIYFRFDRGKRQGERYLIHCLVCDNPICPCDNVEVLFFPPDNPTAEPADRPPNVRLDVRTGKLDRKPSSKADKEFTKEFMADLSREDWRLLQDIFYNEKLYWTEEADLTQLEADFPEKEIEKKSVMIPYREIIPHDQKITITVGERIFQVEDLYCVRSQCPCTNVHVLFLSGADHDRLFPGRPVEPEHEVYVILDLKTREWQVETEAEGLGIPASEMIAVLRKEYDVVRIYKERRRTLRILYRNYLKRIGKAPTAEEDPTVPSRRKVGRNDPCPCGSGKKYKKCCLAKDS